MKGYRKMSVIVLTVVSAIILLICGYNVEKLSWLSTPVAAFMAANLVEYVAPILEKLKNVK